MFRPLIVALAILANVMTAHAQGSAGGNVGKSDQSISGGPLPGKTPLLEKAPKGLNTNPPSLNLKGHWQWKAVCNGQTHVGVFEISEASGTRFSGAFHSDIPGRLFDGQVQGDRVFFKREGVPLQVQTWAGNLTLGSMRGNVSSPFGTCTFGATR